MAKTKRLITEQLKNTDIVAEVIDARIPKSSKNPDLDEIIKDKPRIILLNKAGLADDKITALWQKRFLENGSSVLITDCKTGKGIADFLPLVKEILKDKIQRRKERNIEALSLKIMLAGVPNVGKSTLINTLAKAKKAKVEDRPGVTRTKQLISIAEGFDLYDMPGILSHKIEDHESGVNLAVTGAIKDEIMDLPYLATKLLSYLYLNYKNELFIRYKLKEDDLKEKTGNELLMKIAGKRGFLMSGGVYDTERAASIVLDEFRAGKIGKITLERP